MPAVERHYRLWLLIVWLAGATIAIGLCFGSIAAFTFPDPDDVMRLAEVRDWMAGQSWFDVSQHRMNLPTGLSMHWSRWLDVPLAAVIALNTPLVGQRAAETIAAVAIPILTLGATMALVAEITRRRSGAGPALLAAACCMLSIGVWYAMRPMRIDHHGWQIVAGLGLVLALLARRDLRGAAIAGLCGALWTHISLEGLAFTAGAAAWLGLRWIASPAERFRLPAFLGALTLGGILLYFSVHGFELIKRTYCDQASPVHLAVLGLAALATFGAAALAPKAMPARLALMAGAALLCGLLYRLGAPQCAGGPFATLGPLGYRLWYLNVPEGVPLWHLPRSLALLWGLFPWVGLAGAFVALRRAASDRAAATDYLALLAIATAIGLLVTRAGAFANLLALPGAITLIMLVIARTKAWRMPARVVARTAALLLLTPDGAGLAALLASAPQSAAAASGDARCGTIDALAPLGRLPHATILAPLDMGPALIVATGHAAVTGPYHRDPAALEDVLRFFTTGDAQAIAVHRRAGYVAFCANDGEMQAMAKFAPAGLAARLLHNRAPGWLQTIKLPGTAGLKLYRVD
ncbi:MAG TPA: hypothetical protein VK533_04120 [Sphingomonas sp.]|uniref:hypothetical protein n=1 Tax=Sphingomonas sp. TaxID=28214 RepID=UPI002B5DA920|nr:hypothetical protein [Sphingomonas sp.]HMI18710.1 hypothetical protein [Sphingomonas sp.]